MSARRKVLPAFEVKRDDPRLRHRPGRLNPLLGSHRQVMRSYCRHTRGSHEKERHPNIEAPGNFLHSFVPDRIPGDVNRLAARFRAFQNEPNHRSAIHIRRPVPGWRRRHLDPFPVRPRQIHRLPCLQSKRVPAEPFRASPGGQYPLIRGKETTARVVEVIEMMIVAQQYGIHAPQLVSC